MVNSVSFVTFDHPFVNIVVFVIVITVVTVRLKSLPLVYMDSRTYGEG
jgi:hypothetical protein